MNMIYPKIVRAEAIGEHIIRVEFTNQEIKDYDISVLIEKPMFAPCFQQAYNNADTALYEAKQNGKNQVVSG
ncbi:MAG: hypothetical protein EA342_10730 [Leptolyngbya sp. LCM1.Bin17]|nr:MAG: hypothetical protein EA342_10730 [Leptolyngbya sp. LCM1.Bin17]